MEKLNIPIILGTGRNGRWSEKVFNTVVAYAKTREEMNVEPIDVRDYATPVTEHDNTTPQEQQWQAKAAAADGFIIVTPEYNHGYPGELKMLLDKAFDQYLHKVFGFVTVSEGGLGGARVAEQLLNVTNALNCITSNKHVYVSKVETLFEEDGSMKAAEKAALEPRLKKLFDDVAWYAAALKAAR